MRENVTNDYLKIKYPNYVLRSMPWRGTFFEKLYYMNGVEKISRNVSQQDYITPTSIIKYNDRATFQTNTHYSFDYEVLFNEFKDKIYVVGVLNKKASPGFPWILSYANKGNFVKAAENLWPIVFFTYVCIWFWAQHGEIDVDALEMLQNGITGVFTVFIKEEPNKLAKLQEDMGRTIKPEDIVYCIIRWLLMRDYLSDQYADWKNSCSIAGMPVTADSMVELIDFIKSEWDGQPMCSDDSKNWEETVTENDVLKYVLQVAHKLKRIDDATLQGLHTTQQVKDWLKGADTLVKMLYFVEMHSIDYFAYFKDGDIVYTNYVGRTSSGKLTTNDSNKVMRATTQITIMEKLGYVVYKHLNMGDDMIHNCDDKRYVEYGTRMGKHFKDVRQADEEGFIDFVSQRLYIKERKCEFAGLEKMIIAFMNSEQSIDMWRSLYEHVGRDVLSFPGVPQQIVEYANIKRL